MFRNGYWAVLMAKDNVSVAAVLEIILIFYDVEDSIIIILIIAMKDIP